MKENLKAEVKFDTDLGKWIIYIQYGLEKIPLGHTVDKNLGTFEYEKYDSRQDAVNYIKKKEGLELKKLNKDKCKAFLINDEDTVIAENKKQALDWYMDYIGSNPDEDTCEEVSLNETYYIIDTEDEEETIGDGLERQFKYENNNITAPFIICSTEW